MRLLLPVLLTLAHAGFGQAAAPPLPSEPPLAWVQASADRQVHIIQRDDNIPLRYRTRKIDDNGDTTREVIESRDGMVARLVERDGHALTRKQDEDERDRLTDVISHPGDFQRHQKRSLASQNYSIELVRQFPRSMLFRYTPGQPQVGAERASQVVIDFQPDPNFKPPTIVSELLTGIEGRVWIDLRTQTLVRMEVRVVRPVNFGWGMLARLFPGGTADFEQVPIGPNRWAFSHMEDHLKVREVMLHTSDQHLRVSAWNFRPLASPMSLPEAVASLLALEVPLQP